MQKGRKMTNKELREVLQQYPDELPVTFLNYEYGDHNDINRIVLESREGFILGNNYTGPHIVLE
jgi:hypothetical protein